MQHRPRFLAGFVALIVAGATAGPAMAWGDAGHRMVGTAAMQALPAELPAFLRTAEAAADVGELAREPDRSKGAGKIHDSARDPAHFVDVDDAGKVMGGPPLQALPPTRADYETALRAAGSDTYKAGYLSYSLVDGWQQLVKDLAYWRAGVIAARLEKDPKRRAWIRDDHRRRERLVVTNLGIWAHYVGDAAQPMHMSIHYNGWGDFPNPQGFTRERIHFPFEGPFVRANVRLEQVRAGMRPYRDCACPIEARTVQYLQSSYDMVIPFYEMEKAGGLKPGDPRGRAFAAERLASAASELRDLVVDAWKASASAKVGFPETSLADIESGKADGYLLLYGAN